MIGCFEAASWLWQALSIPDRLSDKAGRTHGPKRDAAPHPSLTGLPFLWHGPGWMLMGLAHWHLLKIALLKGVRKWMQRCVLMVGKVLLNLLKPHYNLGGPASIWGPQRDFLGKSSAIKFLSYWVASSSQWLYNKLRKDCQQKHKMMLQRWDMNYN